MASNDPKQTGCFFSSIASSLSNFDSAMSKSVNGAARYEVDGYVYNSDEEPKILMTGKWNHSTSYQPCDSDGEPLPGTEFKEGDLSKAGFEKSSLEEKQRVEKRNRETKRHQFTPRWFDKTDEIVPTSWDDLEIYSYNGKYIQHCALVEDSSDHADTIDIKSMEFNPLQYENLAAK